MKKTTTAKNQRKRVWEREKTQVVHLYAVDKGYIIPAFTLDKLDMIYTFPGCR